MKCTGYVMKNHNEMCKVCNEKSQWNMLGYIMKNCDEIPSDTFEKSQWNLLSIQWKLPHIYWKIAIEMAWQTYKMPLENFSYFMTNPSQSMKMRMKAEEVGMKIWMKLTMKSLWNAAMIFSYNLWVMPSI